MIEITNVTKRYRGRTVVNDLSLTVGTGSVFGFLGQNGAGKTTLMKMLVGITNPDHGTIAVGGRPSSDRVMRERIGYMPEAPYFYDRLTAMEFLRFCGGLFESRFQQPDRWYGEILTTVGIAPEARHRPIGTYSKGMKQRLGFAQALVNDPDYLFLDEPLDGLDPIGRREIKSIVKDLKRRKKTIFFNSHILFDTEELCDAVGIIHDGALLFAGETSSFLNGKTLEDRFVEVVSVAARDAAKKTA